MERTEEKSMCDIDLPPLMASELVGELEQLIDRHGDMLVTIAANDAKIREVRAYDENGNSIGNPVEFALHGWG